MINEKTESIIKEHITSSKSANKHDAKRILLVDLLRNLFNEKLDDILPGIEKKLKSSILGVKGSADLIFSAIIFEIKVNLDSEIDDAEKQLKKYFQALYEKRPEEKYLGIATDGMKFKSYIPIIVDNQVDKLRKISELNLEHSTASEALLWLDSYFFKLKLRPSANDLRRKYGQEGSRYPTYTEELIRLWNEVEVKKEIAFKLDQWAKYMEIVYGGRPEVQAFIDQTYLVTLVKIIVYLRLSGDPIISEDKIKRILTGEYFSSYGILNLIEEDFFIWILDPEIVDRTLRLFCKLAKELLRYDFSQIDEDFFKEIYQEIVKRSERHKIGEYYTPEWLTELILQEVIDIWNERNKTFPRMLDPACGSGTFLCNAIKIAKQRPGLEPKDVLKWITENIVGIDINPLAVTIAKANYIIALGDLLRFGQPIIIPVYVADSMKLPVIPPGTFELIEVYQIEVEGEEREERKRRKKKTSEKKEYYIRLPSSVANREMLGQIIETFKVAVKYYREKTEKESAIKIFESEISSLSKNEIQVLTRTLHTIFRLIDNGLDAIWVFILSNIYAPITLKQTKFDIIIGNPPWIAMRYIENKKYQDFLKDEVKRCKLLESTEIHLFTHMEAATLFFCSSSDLYLNDDGLIAFVMPRSVLTGAFQHINFKQFKEPQMELLKILDFEDVSPLFNVPSCVLIALKDGETKYPVLARKYAGKLTEKNVYLNDAINHLSVVEYMYEPPKIPTKAEYSWYHERVKQGSTIVPRCLWFVDFIPHPTLGMDVNKPFVKSAEDALKNAKKRWKGIELKDNVEIEFLYSTLLGGDLVPFGYSTIRPIVIPLNPKSARFELLGIVALRNQGFVSMADWLENAQKMWEEKRTEKAKSRFQKVIDRLDYNSLLSKQNPRKRYIVLYNTSGTNLVSSVIDRENLPSFQILKLKIRPKGFLAESTTYFYETNTQDAAHYICAVLNSDILNDALKPLQPRGLWGARHFHRRPFMFPIAEFDKNNADHTKFAEISKICHAKVSSIKFTKKSVAGKRKEARDAIKGELEEINRIASSLIK